MDRTVNLYYCTALPIIRSSAAASGWAGWGALAHPEFGSSVNPITIRGADYAHHITASPPGLENPAASLQIGKCNIIQMTLKSVYFKNAELGDFDSYVH